MVRRALSEAKVSLSKRYHSNTPAKWKKIGDALVFAIPTIQTAILNLPLDPHTQVILSLLVAVLLAAAKFITNFFSEDTNE